MNNEEKQAPDTIGSTKNSTNSLSQAEQKMYDDFHKSGISDETIMKYRKAGLLKPFDDYWQLNYPALKENWGTDYSTKRLYKYNKCKYIRPPEQESRIFRPLEVNYESIIDGNLFFVVTEGEKKAIAAAEQGIPTIALSGVYCWKKKPKPPDDKNVGEDIIDNPPDIITDLKEIPLENKTIYLCFDNDVMTKKEVKTALLSLSAYCIGERHAKVKIIYLPNTGEKLGLDDFLVKYGKQEFMKLVKNAVEVDLKTIQNEYLGIKNSKNEFPIEIFEDDLRNFIEDIQKRLDAPIEYIAMSILTGAAVIMNGKYTISVNKIMGWIDNPILWVALVGEPSRKKSPCLYIVKRIIDELENTFEIEFQEKMKEYKAKTSRGGSRGKNKQEEEIETPEKPNRQRLTTQDTTVEAISKIVLKNLTGCKRGISLWLDELGMFLSSLNQYKGGKCNSGIDITYYLQAWNKQKYNVVRSTNDTDFIIYPAHSIIGTIQPKVLTKTIFSKDLGGENGFMERWLYVTTEYKETGLIPENLPPMNNQLLKDKLTNLFNITSEKQYSFSSEAQKCYNQFNYDMVQKKQDYGIPEIMKSYLQKQTQYVERFALILHCIKNPTIAEIQEETVKKAILLSEYFVKSYKNIVIKRVNSNDLVDETYEKLLIQEKITISPTELYKSNTSKYKSAQNAKIVLEEMQNRAYGRIVKASNGISFKIYKYY